MKSYTLLFAVFCGLLTSCQRPHYPHMATRVYERYHQKLLVAVPDSALLITAMNQQANLLASAAGGVETVVPEVEVTPVAIPTEAGGKEVLLSPQKAPAALGWKERLVVKQLEKQVRAPASAAKEEGSKVFLVLFIGVVGLLLLLVLPALAFLLLLAAFLVAISGLSQRSGKEAPPSVT
jgi:hypothetical protein